MYTVIREDVRPSTDVKYFEQRIPYVDKLFVSKGLTRNYSMSPDGLKRVVTFRAPNKEAWDSFTTDNRFRAEYLPLQDEYNTANGITHTVVSIA